MADQTTNAGSLAVLIATALDVVVETMADGRRNVLLLYPASHDPNDATNRDPNECQARIVTRFNVAVKAHNGDLNVIDLNAATTPESEEAKHRDPMISQESFASLRKEGESAEKVKRRRGLKFTRLVGKMTKDSKSSKSSTTSNSCLPGFWSGSAIGASIGFLAAVLLCLWLVRIRCNDFTKEF